MAKERTSKSQYESNFGGGFIAPPQYLIECMCFLIARKEGIQLTNRFWMQPRWQKHFRWQVKPVNELLKLYSPEVILDALRDRRCYNIASFGNKSKLLPLLKEKQAAYDLRMKSVMEAEEIDRGSVVEKPRKQMSRKNQLSKLRELDDARED